MVAAGQFSDEIQNYCGPNCCKIPIALIWSMGGALTVLLLPSAVHVPLALLCNYLRLSKVPSVDLDVIEVTFHIGFEPHSLLLFPASTANAYNPDMLPLGNFRQASLRRRSCIVQ